MLKVGVGELSVALQHRFHSPDRSRYLEVLRPELVRRVFHVLGEERNRLSWRKSVAREGGVGGNPDEAELPERAGRPVGIRTSAKPEMGGDKALGILMALANRLEEEDLKVLISLAPRMGRGGR